MVRIPDPGARSRSSSARSQRSSAWKGLPALGGYELGRDYETVVQAPALPREIKVMAEGALLSLSGGLCGYLYLQFAPRRGLFFNFSEQFYSMRNAYYRAKRRRAARKFEVYMGKQGRKVKFDSEGRYIDPDEERKNPKDKRWMN